MKNIKLNKTILWLGLILFSFFVGNCVKAEFVLTNSYTSGSNFNMGTSYVPNTLTSFVAASSTIDKIGFRIWREVGEPLPNWNLNVKICEASDCATNIFETNLLGSLLSETVSSWIYFEPSEPIEVSTGTTYYIKTVSTGYQYRPYAKGDGINSPYALNYLLYTSIINLQEDVEIIELDEFDFKVTVESEYSLQYDKITECIIGDSCLFWYGYNDVYVGYNIYLMDPDSSYTEEAYDENEMIDFSIKSDYLTFPIQTTAGDYEYCLFLEHPTEASSSEYICGIKAHWSTMNTFWKQFDCNCNDVATSSDFFWGIECGFRQFTCWAFQPATTTVAELALVMSKASNEFPTNIFINTYKTFEQVGTSSSQLVPFLVPTEWNTLETATTVGYLIDPEAFAQQEHYSILTTVRTYIDKFIWFLFMVYIIFRIFKRREEVQEI